MFWPTGKHRFGWFLEPTYDYSFARGHQRSIGCELRGQLAGYDSQSLELGVRERLDNPNVGTILMRRLGPDEGSTVSATTLAAPKDARKAYEKGLDAEKKNKLPDAQANLEKAVAAYPKYALAWMELGKVQAAALGAALKAREAAPSVIVTSPLVRAIETAEALAKSLAQENELIVTDRLASGELKPRKLSKLEIPL